MINSTLAPVLLASFVPVLAALVGGTASVLREPGPKLRSGLQHLAAGVVFATAALELLPDVSHGPPLQVIVGFSLGVVTMLGLRSLGKRLEAGASNGAPLPISLVVSTGVDLLVDGLVLGIGFALAERTGVILTIALGLEILFVSMGLATTLAQRGVGRWVAAGIPVAMSLLIGVGALITSTVLAGYSTQDLVGVLAFGSAALLYLVTDELLVEAHEVPDTAPVCAMFFVGFLLFMLLDMQGEH
jgi:ZIP family zinc transporter